MQIKKEDFFEVDYIEISFSGKEKVEVSYIGINGEILKVQHAETLVRGLELIQKENK